MYRVYIKTNKSRAFLSHANVFIYDNDYIGVQSGRTVTIFSYSKENNYYIEDRTFNILEELTINDEVIYKYEVKKI